MEEIDLTLPFQPASCDVELHSLHFHNSQSLKLLYLNALSLNSQNKQDEIAHI